MEQGSATSSARNNALRAMALRPQDERAHFLVALRRARGNISRPLPLALDFSLYDDLAAVALRGWSFAGPTGSWTNGPIAQLLIVPEQAPRGNFRLSCAVSQALTHPRQPVHVVRVDVNGAALAEWTFVHGEAAGLPPPLAIPAAALDMLPAFLITFTVQAPVALDDLGVRGDSRALGIALSGLTLTRENEEP